MQEPTPKQEEFQQLESELRSLLNHSNRLGDSEPSQYLRLRVMAHVQEKARVQEENKQGIRLWRTLGLSFATLSLVLGLSLFLALRSGPTYLGYVDRAMLVKLEVTDMALEDIAFAEVVLPADVEFYSKKFPNLALQRRLRVEWRTASNELPFVIRGLSEGKHRVVIRFYNQEGTEIAVKAISIKFAAEETT